MVPHPGPGSGRASSRAAWSSHVRSSRKASVTGVALLGLDRRSLDGCGTDSRSQVTSPSWHSRSSIEGA